MLPRMLPLPRAVRPSFARIATAASTTAEYAKPLSMKTGPSPIHLDQDGRERRADDLGRVEGDGHQAERADDVLWVDDRRDQRLSAGDLEGERRAGDEGDGDDVPDAHGVGQAEDAEHEGADRHDARWSTPTIIRRL